MIATHASPATIGQTFAAIRGVSLAKKRARSSVSYPINGLEYTFAFGPVFWAHVSMYKWSPQYHTGIPVTRAAVPRIICLCSSADKAANRVFLVSNQHACVGRICLRTKTKQSERKQSAVCRMRHCARASPGTDVRKISGGGSGIRTLGGLSPSSVFKTGAFDHSAKPPTGVGLGTKDWRVKTISGMKLNVWKTAGL